MGGERGPVVMTSVREKQGSPHPTRLLLGRSTALLQPPPTASTTAT